MAKFDEKGKVIEYDETLIHTMRSGQRYYQIDEIRIDRDLSSAAYQRLLVLGHTEGNDTVALTWLANQGYSFDVRSDEGLTLIELAQDYNNKAALQWLQAHQLKALQISAESFKRYSLSLQHYIDTHYKAFKVLVDAGVAAEDVLSASETLMLTMLTFPEKTLIIHKKLQESNLTMTDLMQQPELLDLLYKVDDIDYFMTTCQLTTRDLQIKAPGLWHELYCERARLPLLFNNGHIRVIDLLSLNATKKFHLFQHAKTANALCAALIATGQNTEEYFNLWDKIFSKITRNADRLAILIMAGVPLNRLVKELDYLLDNPKIVHTLIEYSSSLAKILRAGVSFYSIRHLDKLLLPTLQQANKLLELHTVLGGLPEDFVGVNNPDFKKFLNQPDHYIKLAKISGLDKESFHQMVLKAESQQQIISSSAILTTYKQRLAEQARKAADESVSTHKPGRWSVIRLS